MAIENGQVRAFSSVLRNAPKVVRQRAQLVVRKTAKDIERDAKLKAPYRTGNLKNSISTSDLRTVGQSGNMEAVVGPTANYGLFLEMGTSRMAAQPFMGPAADRNEGPFAKALEILAEEALGG